MAVQPKSLEWKNKPKKKITLEKKRRESVWLTPDKKPSKELFRVMCEAGQFIAMHNGFCGFSLKADGEELLFMVSAGDYEFKEWIQHGEEADTLLMSLSGEISKSADKH